MRREHNISICATATLTNFVNLKSTFQIVSDIERSELERDEDLR